MHAVLEAKDKHGMAHHTIMEETLDEHPAPPQNSHRSGGGRSPLEFSITTHRDLMVLVSGIVQLGQLNAKADLRGAHQHASPLCAAVFQESC